ncbi:hypothetical protein T265_04320 [Opisthorchis viverrini]|uniref:Uncharacterized protein n=1 Tax=Opisthorchis viverrini TaxID=6198 RepID=A0A074ZP82_OPIVI|nr:hypothetical protein T265_04320 [Opisthorchis viverrini]KER28936.1 hypothetical protein T265_04320 [Opisthorchis viverrini]
MNEERCECCLKIADRTGTQTPYTGCAMLNDRSQNYSHNRSWYATFVSLFPSLLDEYEFGLCLIQLSNSCVYLHILGQKLKSFETQRKFKGICKLRFINLNDLCLRLNCFQIQGEQRNDRQEMSYPTVYHSSDKT